MTQPVTINYAGRSPGWPRLAKALGITGCLTGAIATGLALWPLPNFYKLPVGTSMRPMGLTFWLCMCAAAGLFISFPLSATCLALGWRDRRARWIASFGILLSLSAIFLGFCSSTGLSLQEISYFRIDSLRVRFSGRNLCRVRTAHHFSFRIECLN